MRLRQKPLTTQRGFILVSAQMDRRADLGQGSLEGEQACCLDLSLHIGQHELDGLEVGDGLPKLFPLLGIIARSLKGRLGNPDGLGSDPDAPRIQDGQGDAEAGPLFAQPVPRRQPVVLKDQDWKRCVALIDPPRTGLMPPVINALCAADSLRELWYLSCSPESLARDLKKLTTAAWTVHKVIPFDFFPRTKHLETLVCLVRS